jgi:thiamine biosynthesis lipoprotein
MLKSCTLYGLLYLMLSGAGCRETPPERYVREATAMNTYVSVSVYDEGKTRDRIARAADAALEEIDLIERLATNYNDTSEVGRVNKASGSDTVVVSPQVGELIRLSLGYSLQSDGAFDITVGPLVTTWDFLTPGPAPPGDHVIKRTLPLVGYRGITIRENQVFLQRRGMALDLGGIAKGYAVDKATSRMRSSGMERFIIDLGGNLGVHWEGTRMLDSTAATIYIRHPREEGEFFGSFRMGTGGVATSGDYQRYYVRDGVRYHHILDPATGYPVTGVVSVTIVARDATSADALSTLVFVLGRERGMRYVEANAGVEGVIVFEENGALKHIVSTGLKGRFQTLGEE